MNEISDPHKSQDLESLLSEYGKADESEREEIIYGVYDNRSRSLIEKINDFFIDRSKIAIKDKAYFFYLMAVMLDAGLSAVETLRILSRRTTNERFRRVLCTVAHHVEHGHSLSKAMSYFPMVFDDADIGIVRSGEAIGHLDQMLFRLAQQTERIYELSLKIKTALIYPVVVIVSLFIAGTVLMLVVIPKLTEIFASSNTKLPMITKVFIRVSQFFMDYWWLQLVIIFGVYVFYRFYQGTLSGRMKIDYYWLKLPIVGELSRKLIIAKFVNMLEIMVAAGMSITKVLEIIAMAIGNDVYRRMLINVKKKVEAGEKISANLAKAPFLFPEVVTQMLRIGEQSASLDRSAHKLAKHFETEAEHSIKRITAVFEPVVIVMIGIVIAIVALAILGPIFSLAEAV